MQGPAVANYLKNTLGSKKVCVVEDSTDYGLGLAKVVRDTLGPVADGSCNISVKKGDKDFSAAVNQVKGASPDAVFYGGYYAEAAPFVQQLRDGGVTATFVSARRHQGPEFVKQAGERPRTRSCPAHAARHRSLRRRSTRRSSARTPGMYSTEGYDLATIMLKGIDSGRSPRRPAGLRAELRRARALPGSTSGPTTASSPAP